MLIQTCPKLIVVKQKGRTKNYRGRADIVEKLANYNKKARASNKVNLYNAC